MTYDNLWSFWSPIKNNDFLPLANISTVLTVTGEYHMQHQNLNYGSCMIAMLLSIVLVILDKEVLSPFNNIVLNL